MTVVTASDTSFYYGAPVTSARTPGFWCNWPQVWDADPKTDTAFSGRADFPASDVLLPSFYSYLPIDPVNNLLFTRSKGLLVGDWNKDGNTTNSGMSYAGVVPKEVGKVGWSKEVWSTRSTGCRLGMAASRGPC